MITPQRYGMITWIAGIGVGTGSFVWMGWGWNAVKIMGTEWDGYCVTIYLLLLI